MREWQVGGPVGDGNDIGVPDLPYMGYLRKDNENIQSRNGSSKDIKLSKQYQDEAWRLNEEDKYYDALSFINAAIRYNPDDSSNWNIKGIILFNILMTNDPGVGAEAYDCYNKALEINPRDKTIKSNKIRLLIRWGIKLLGNEDNQAMIRANEALSIIEDKTSTEYADALTLKAAIYMNTGSYNKAMEYFDKAIETNPLDVEIRKLKLELIRRMADYYDEDLFPWDI